MTVPAPATTDRPLLVSVCIPTFNRAGLLRETIESFTKLRVPDGVRFELLVCNNNCTDDTQAAVESFMGTLEAAHGDAFVGPLQCLFEKNPGRSSALNRLLPEAKGDWIAFIDDDILVDAGWLDAIVTGMKHYPDACILGGPILPRFEKTPSDTHRLLMDKYPEVFGMMVFDRDRPVDRKRLPGGGNMALRRDVLPTNGFDPTLGVRGHERRLGEETVVMQDILEAGGNGWMLADAKVLHYIAADRMNLRHLWRWQVAVGNLWVRSRGRPTPGKLGVAWWAWREMARRAMRAVMRWRPWPSERFFQAFVETAQYWGYLRAKT